MTISSILDLKARAAVEFADNNIGAITPALLRSFLEDVLDTVSPAYGIIRLASQILNFSATPVVIAPYIQNFTETAGYFVNNLAAGTVQRTLNGAPGSRVLIVAGGSVQGPVGRNVLIQLFKNGVATDFSAIATTTGGAERLAFSMTGFDFMLGSDSTYELRASSVGVAANFTFENVILIVQAQTVRAFV